MAMTSCHECHQPLSDQAAACPHCGAPLKPAGTPTRRRLSAIEWTLLLVGAVMMLGGAGLAVLGTLRVLPGLAGIPVLVLAGVGLVGAVLALTALALHLNRKD